MSDLPTADLQLQMTQDDSVDGVRPVSLQRSSVTSAGYVQLSGVYDYNLSAGAALNELSLQMIAPGAPEAAFVVDDVECREVVTTSRGVAYSCLSTYGLSGDLELIQDLDPDGDGIPTWQEFATGTDPLNKCSNVILKRVQFDGLGSLVLLWSGSAASGGLSGWTVWRSDDLAHWKPVALNLWRSNDFNSLN